MRRQKVPHIGGLDIGGDKAFADAAGQNEGQLAALDLLVLPDQRHQHIDIGLVAGNIGNARRQADGCKMTRDARGLFRRQQAAPGRERESQRHADRHRLAMQQATGKSRGRFQRMAESMAEIEQRALAAFAFVARDDIRLHPATGRHRDFARGAAFENALPIRFQPGEESGIADQSIFGNLGITGAHLARRQRVEQTGRIQFCCEACNDLGKNLDAGYLDAAFIVSKPSPHMQLLAEWSETLVWVCGPDFLLSPGAPIPVLSRPHSVPDQVMFAALERHGMPFSVTFVAADFSAQLAALRAGLGFLVMPERMVTPDLKIARDYYLPPLPGLVAGFYMREGLDARRFAPLIARFDEALNAAMPCAPPAGRQAEGVSAQKPAALHSR